MSVVIVGIKLIISGTQTVCLQGGQERGDLVYSRCSTKCWILQAGGLRQQSAQEARDVKPPTCCHLPCGGQTQKLHRRPGNQSEKCQKYHEKFET